MRIRKSVHEAGVYDWKIFSGDTLSVNIYIKKGCCLYLYGSKLRGVRSRHLQERKRRCACEGTKKVESDTLGERVRIFPGTVYEES